MAVSSLEDKEDLFNYQAIFVQLAVWEWAQGLSSGGHPKDEGGSTGHQTRHAVQKKIHSTIFNHLSILTSQGKVAGSVKSASPPLNVVSSPPEISAPSHSVQGTLGQQGQGLLPVGNGKAIMTQHTGLFWLWGDLGSGHCPGILPGQLDEHTWGSTVATSSH